MDFGKQENLDGVDFSLPDTPGETLRVLETTRQSDAGALYVGGPVWARRDWVGKLYPDATPARRFLEVYAKRATAIELNATFYNLPSLTVMEQWRDQTPVSFHFCPKLHQVLSHDRALQNVTAATGRFCQRFAPLGPRLGPFFLQLPPWFSRDRLADLLAFVRGFPRDVRLSVEFRHQSWFSNQVLHPETAAAFEEVGVGTVITDVAGRRDVCHARLTTPWAFVRFAGNQKDAIDHQRLEVWVERLRAWLQAGLREAYFFVHQPDDAVVPELLAFFCARARAAGLPAPEIRLESERGQVGLF